MCASVVQVMYVFCASPLEQMTPTIYEFFTLQLSWINQLLPNISDLPAPALEQGFLNMKDSELGLLLARVVAILA